MKDEIWVNARDAMLDPLMAEFAGVISDYFQQQLDDLLKQIDTNKANLFEALNLQGMAKILDTLSYNTTSFIERTITPYIMAGYQVGWSEQYSNEGRGIDLNTLVGLGLKNPRAVKYATTRAGQLITEISDTTKKLTTNLIAKAAAEGWSYDRLAEELRKTYEGFKSTTGGLGLPMPAHIKDRATLIAVTELGQSYAQANMDVAELLSSEGLPMVKRWIAVGDERTCPICGMNAMAGWQDYRDPFPAGQDWAIAHPGCRCDVEFRVWDPTILPLDSVGLNLRIAMSQDPLMPIEYINPIPGRTPIPRAVYLKVEGEIPDIAGWQARKEYANKYPDGVPIDFIKKYTAMSPRPEYAKMVEQTWRAKYDRWFNDFQKSYTAEEKKLIASNLGVPVGDLKDRDKFLQALTRKYQQEIDKSPLIVRRDDHLEDLLKDKRMKTQFETGRSNGAYSPEMRAFLEKYQFGYADTVPVDIRPVYGYVDLPHVTEGTEWYGGCQFYLKPSVRARTTITAGDSLDVYGGAYWYDALDYGIGELSGKCPALPGLSDNLAPQQMFFGYLGRTPPGAPGISPQWVPPIQTNDDVEGWFSRLICTGPGDYSEIQVHGGVRLDDIEYIVMPGHDGGPGEALKKEFEKQGIRVYWEGEEPKWHR